VFLILTVYSCRELKCDGFPDSELKWIPYKINDTIKYSNNNDTIEFIVEQFYKSEPISERGGFFDWEIFCYIEAYYYTSKAKNDYQIKENCDNGNSMRIEITENDFFYFELYSRESFLDTIKLEYFEDTLINSKSYKEVFLITKDTIHYSPKIAWIIKASDKGIVEFYDFELKKTWNLIDN